MIPQTNLINKRVAYKYIYVYIHTYVHIHICMYMCVYMYIYQNFQLTIKNPLYMDL